VRKSADNTASRRDIGPPDGIAAESSGGDRLFHPMATSHSRLIATSASTRTRPAFTGLAAGQGSVPLTAPCF
jgi:hypothetical protein